MAEGSVSDGIRLPDVQGSGAQGTNPHPDLISITTIYCKSTINDRYAKIWLWSRGVWTQIKIQDAILKQGPCRSEQRHVTGHKCACATGNSRCVSAGRS